MWDSIKDLIRDTPELALFISLGLGYAIGKIRFGPIQLGGVCGTLLVALVLGQIGVKLDDGVKTLAFVLFIFSLGYMAGPQFFANLNRKGLRIGVLSFIEVGAVLILVPLAAIILNLDQGTASGLLAGAATESAVIGTATEAIGHLDLPSSEIATMQNNVVTAYSISYLFGLITIVLFTSQVAPLLMRVNLKEEAAKLWRKLGGGEDMGEGKAPALPTMVGRLYQVSQQAAGKTIGTIEAALPGATIERVLRAGGKLDISPDRTLLVGDLALVVGRRTAVVPAEQLLGPEQDSADGMDVALETREVVFTQKKLSGKTLGELRDTLGATDTHGVYLSTITRMEKPIPTLNSTAIQNGDVLTITGAPSDVERVSKKIGYPVPSTVADFVYLSAGLIVGILIGLIVLNMGDVAITLGMGGGALISGLVFGWLRAKHPTFGSYHPAAASVVKDFGLATFIAATGLGAGKDAIELLKDKGIALPICGILLVLIPAGLSLFIGRRFLKMEVPVLIGGIAGQQCSTPAITQVVQVAGNNTPMIGYTVTYALSNVMLPILGPIMVAIVGWT